MTYGEIAIILPRRGGLTQSAYDATKNVLAEPLPSSITPETVRMLDLGFDSTVGSFLWVITMPEILDLSGIA